jgi:hypothetical protein
MTLMPSPPAECPSTGMWTGPDLMDGIDEVDVQATLDTQSSGDGQTVPTSSQPVPASSTVLSSGDGQTVPASSGVLSSGGGQNMANKQQGGAPQESKVPSDDGFMGESARWQNFFNKIMLLTKEVEACPVPEPQIEKGSALGGVFRL